MHLVEDLLPGQYVLLVRAENAAGIFDATPARHAWTVTRPETTILYGPEATTIETFAEFAFSSNDPLAEFECSLDGESFSSCLSPHLIENLLPGQHELLVRARNEAGTVDSSAVSYRWRVTPMPDTAIVNRPADPTDSRNATFTFESNLQGVTFECALDEAADTGFFTPCPSPVTYEDLAFGERQGENSPPSSAHSYTRSRPSAPKTKVALLLSVVTSGPELIITGGAGPRTSQLHSAGSRSTLPAASLARTAKSCEP